MAGNLTINSGGVAPGAGLNMQGMTGFLGVERTVLINNLGTLTLSSAVGGDIKVGGDLTRNTSGTLTQNGREVEMNGSALQTISGVTTFNFLAVSNSASSVRLTDNLTINNRLRLSNGLFDLNGRTCTLADVSKILRVNGTMSASPTAAGVYDLEYQNSVTSGVEYLASSTAVRDLIITTGNTLTLGDNRTFNRDLILSGGDLNLGGFILTAKGNAVAPSFAGSITVSGGGTRSITGPAGSIFDITGLGGDSPTKYTKTVSTLNSSTLSFDSNVLVRIGDGSVDFGIGNPTTINGTLQVLLAGSVGQILHPCYYGVGSTLRFANTVDYQVGSNDKTWASGISGNPGIPWNVEVNDATTDLQLQDTRVLRNNLTITGGTFTLSNTLSLGGNWTSYNSTAFIEGNSTVEFNGTALQTLTVPGGEIFKNIKLNNTASGSGIGLQVNNNLTVEGTATFSNGKLDLNNFNVEIGTTSTNGGVIEGSSNSYVIVWDGADNGNIIHRVNSAAGSVYNFPMGDLTNYTPFDLTLNTGILSSAFLTGGMRAQNHPQLGTSTNYLGRYWIMNQSGITGDSLTPISYSVAYKYVNNDRSIPAQEASIYPAKYNAGGWQTPTGTGTNAMIGTGSINTASKTLNWSGLSTFSEFTGLGDGSPLPVTWLNFDAQFNNATSNVDVSWTTASEINNDYFEVLRSIDAVNFNVIGTVDGAGNSSLVKDYKFEDSNPLTGISYYKIRQVDFNGMSDNTEIRAVSNTGGEATATLFTYPNPLIGQDLTIVYSNLDKGNWEYRLVDITGKIVLAKNRTSDLNTGTFTLNLEQLPAGVYLFQLNTQSQNFTRKITISK
jgi:hypothetical protein